MPGKRQKTFMLLGIFSKLSRGSMCRLSLSDVFKLKKTLQYKIRTNSKLNPVDVHLINNFADIQKNLFAPSWIEICRYLSRALIKPSIVVLVTCFSIQGSYYRISPEKIAEAENLEPSNEIDFTTLALELAKDTNPNSGSLWKLPDLPVVSNIASLPIASNRIPNPTSIDSRLGNQRSLIKFISGIIAAFKPDIKDSSNISRYIVELSAAEKVDPIYVAAVIAIESRFTSTARSGAGALGLMQLMPATAKELANSDSHRTSHLSDPKTNIRLGISYLKQLEQRFSGNRFLSLAAYNWGPNNISKKKRIPGSVRKYANTVIERTVAWRRHFERATKVAESLQTVSLDHTDLPS